MDKINQPERLRNLPSVEKVLNEINIIPLLDQMPRRLVVRTVRDYLEKLRRQILSGEDVEFKPENLAKIIERQKRPSIKRAINGLGVVLHTGLRTTDKLITTETNNVRTGGYTFLNQRFFRQTKL